MTEKKKFAVTFAVIAVAIVFIVIGVMREEHLDVLRKAVNICLECIGIG